MYFVSLIIQNKELEERGWLLQADQRAILFHIVFHPEPYFSLLFNETVLLFGV